MGKDPAGCDPGKPGTGALRRTHHQEKPSLLVWCLFFFFFAFVVGQQRNETDGKLPRTQAHQILLALFQRRVGGHFGPARIGRGDRPGGSGGPGQGHQNLCLLFNPQGPASRPASSGALRIALQCQESGGPRTGAPLQFVGASGRGPQPPGCDRQRNLGDSNPRTSQGGIGSARELLVPVRGSIVRRPFEMARPAQTTDPGIDRRHDHHELEIALAAEAARYGPFIIASITTAAATLVAIFQPVFSVAKIGNHQFVSGLAIYGRIQAFAKTLRIY